MERFSLRKAWEDTRFMLGFIWREDKKIFLYKVFTVLLAAAQTLFGTLYIKWIIDSITTSKDIIKTVMLIVGIQLLFFLLYSLSTWFGNILTPRASYRIRNSLQNEFVNMAMKQDLQCYEDPEFYDNYAKATRYADTKALDFLDIIANAAQGILSTATLLSVVSLVSPIMLIFAAASIAVTLLDQHRSIQLSMNHYEAEETLNRQSDYMKRIAHHRQFAKEVRLFNLRPFILWKLNTAFREKYRLFCDTNRKYWGFKYGISCINTLVITPGLMIYLAVQTIRGVISIGSFSMLYGITFNIANELSQIVMTLDKLKFESEYYVSHLRGVLDYHPTIENKDTGCDVEEKPHSVEFSHVSFYYPNHSRLVLRDISFELSPGKKMAIVGRNGAGKSTIVKLLLRLYDATEGNIYFDGRPIDEIQIEQLRRCFSVTMQDFNVYAFTIGENIEMDIPDKESAENITNALAFAGLQKKVSQLEKGAQTYLTREFEEEGIELSGGEKQKLAIARAFAQRADIFVLDEANSALDPLAEYELNNRLMSHISDKSVIFVTHRLSTTIMADEILLIEDGKIAERGTHIELMAQNGLYAEMFYRQAEAYRAEKAANAYE